MNLWRHSGAPEVATPYRVGWTFHRAGPNRSERQRRVMTIDEPVNEYQHNDLRSRMPGCTPGDLAASPLNPVLYDAGR